VSEFLPAASPPGATRKQSRASLAACASMTYNVHGKQYVVIAAGGHGKLSTKQGDYVLAFALP